MLDNFDMSIKTDKIQWVGNDQIGEHQIAFRGDLIDKSPSLLYMGLKLDPKGSLQTHIEHREAQATAAWARVWKSTSFTKTPRGVKIRLYNSTYIKSLTWGMASFPHIASVFTGMSTTALKPLSCLYGKKRSEQIEDWWKRVRNKLRRDRHQGIIRHPMQDIANQWRLIKDYTEMHTEHTLTKLLQWRGTAWLNLKLSRSQRPARRRGQVPQLLDEIVDKIDGSHFAVIAFVLKYLKSDKKQAISFHSSPSPSPPFSQVFNSSVQPGA